MTEMSKKIFFMFFIFGVMLSSPKGKKKIKSHKDTDSYLCGLLLSCMRVFHICLNQIIPLTLSSNAESAAFAPSPIEIMICL